MNHELKIGDRLIWICKKQGWLNDLPKCEKCKRWCEIELLGNAKSFENFFEFRFVNNYFACNRLHKVHGKNFKINSDAILQNIADDIMVAI